MWVSTVSGDFLNLDNVERLVLKADSVVALSGGKELVLFSGKSSKTAYKLICEGLAASRNTMDIASRLASEEFAEAKKAEAVKAAEQRDLERKRSIEEKSKDKEAKK